MQEFTKMDKMVHLIHSNPYLLPVIHRFGLALGFKNKTVDELCREYGINTDFFISIVNTFHNENFFPEEKLLSYSPLLIIDYLRKTHRYYVNYSLPRIEMLLHKLQESSSGTNSDMKMIEEFYLKYKNELLEHINEEEEKVFPYIEELLKNAGKGNLADIEINFEKEHENVDFELDDLKNLILKYIVPDYDVLICNELLIEIFRFGKDINDHARMEDAILIPQIKLIQQGR